ncbi:glycosyltransferase family 32 protein [Stutzerimonas urumqiensis]|uniref:glycosyltransferase family 32 protein n=1 Tax=Stutzerimonas urumqiensis TaxID=638269 RepID=UPI000EB2DB54|nr:glycosyltransferase [Stutzerimonas urumqiensis]
MIPKRLHYCWFGGNPLPLQARRCLASWAFRLPEYELVRWDESRFDPAAHSFTAAAYAAGRYAFVSDYVRMLALQEQGGIYCDVDVEVLQPLSELHGADFFIGLEDQGRFSTSIIGAVSDHWLPRAMLAYYDATAFDCTRLSELVNVNEVSRLLLAHGFSGDDRDQAIDAERVLRIGRLADARGAAGADVRPLARHLYAGTWRPRAHKSAASRTVRALRKLPEQMSTWIALQRYRLAVAASRARRGPGPGDDAQ